MRQKILAFITDGKKFLVLRNNPSEPEKHGGDFWFTVTGGVEKGESYEETVKREVKEETNLVVKEIINMNWGCTYKNRHGENGEHYYLAVISPGKVKLSIEHVNYEWLSFQDFLERISWKGNKKELKRILEDALNKKADKLIVIDDFISHKRIFYNVAYKRITSSNGKKHILTWVLCDDFSKLNGKKVVGAYCLAFDKNGKMLIVDVKRKNYWTLPGGGIEGDESYIESLKRECIEEANMEISDIRPLGYNHIVEVDENGQEKEFYQVRYFARIKKLHKQTVDPATGVIPFRKLIKPEYFLYFCPWGFQGDEMIGKAVKMNGR